MKYYVVAKSEGFNNETFLVDADDKSKAIQKVMNQIVENNKSKFNNYQVTSLSCYDIENTV